MRGASATILVLTLALFTAACGGLKQVTYVDPNEAGTSTAGVTATPVERHGADVMERAKALVRIRGALVVARTLAATDAPDTAVVLTNTIEDDLPVVEPRIASSNEVVALSLRRSLTALRDKPPANAVGYAREVRRITRTLLPQVDELAIPAAARQDVGFRAMVLHETLLDAATRYESSFEGTTARITAVADYQVAYGLIIDAATRQSEALPEDARVGLRGRIDRIARSTTPGPNPPMHPRNPETAVNELSTLADDVALAAQIDPTYPTPEPSTPDQLRTLKRSVAAAVEAWERGDHEVARRTLSNAHRTSLATAAPGLAAVSPDSLIRVETDIVITLPRAMRAGSDIAAIAVDVDADLDEAIKLVEDELSLQRDAG